MTGSGPSSQPQSVDAERKGRKVKIRKVDVTALDRPRSAAGRSATKALTPAQRERQLQQRQLHKLMDQLTDNDTAFEVRLGRGEKPVCAFRTATSLPRSERHRPATPSSSGS